MSSMKRKVASLSKDVENDLLHCGVCFEKFNTEGERVPRILTQCGHTYCSKCLSDIFEDQGVLQCPMCRVETKIRRKNGTFSAKSLQINYQTVQLLDATERSKPRREEIARNACTGFLDNTTQKLCMNCEGESPQAAIVGCLDCSAAYCDDCNKQHFKMKVNKNHRVVAFEEYADRRLNKCLKHPAEAITHMCSDCEVMACEVGLSFHHAGHAVYSIEDSADRERKRIQILSADIRDQIVIAQSKLEKVEQKAVGHRKNATELHDKVEKEGSKLMAMLVERIDAAHAAIEEKAGISDRRLTVEKDSLVDHLTQAHSCLENVQHLAPTASVVQVCTISQDLRTVLSTLQQGNDSLPTELPPTATKVAGGSSSSSSSSSSAAGCAMSSLESPREDIARQHARLTGAAAVTSRLVVDDGVTSRTARLIDVLFAVQELPVIEQGCIFPLTRSEGGVIGSDEILACPKGLAIRVASPASGLPSLLFVVDRDENRVQVFDANSGAFLRSLGRGLEGTAELLKGANDLALRPAPTGEWHLYVLTDSFIQVFDADTGAFLRMIGEGEFEGARCFALREPPAGSALPCLLFVSCRVDHTVKVLHADSGKLLRTIGAEAGEDMRGPGGLVLGTALTSPASGERSVQSLLYITCAVNHCVRVFDADTGVHMRTFGKSAAGGKRCEHLDNPIGIALQQSVLGSGTTPSLLYVADFGKPSCVRVFDADTGAYVRTIGGRRDDALGRLRQPSDIVLHPGPDGSLLLFVSEQGNQRVRVFRV